MFVFKKFIKRNVNKCYEGKKENKLDNIPVKYHSKSFGQLFRAGVYFNSMPIIKIYSLFNM